MLIIRLQRVGRKNDPSFRLILTDKRKAAKTGAFLEIVGSYDARKSRLQLEEARIKHWLANGAQTSGTVHNLLVDAKIISGKKRNVSPPFKAGSAVIETEEKVKQEPEVKKEKITE